MSTLNNTSVCPVERAGGLDNSLRKLIQNPRRILEPYIEQGMTILDLGCGPGFFTVELANLLMGRGKVIAADLQEGMLEIVNQKIKGTELEKIIQLHKCNGISLDIATKVDFILAFYMVHEVPDHDRLFNELKNLLKPNGIIFIIEPRFHVTKEAFTKMTMEFESLGLKVIARPKISLSRAIVLSNKD